MKKKIGLNRVLLSLAIALALVITLVALVFINDFIGWFYHAADAGTITGITIHHKYPADAWHGFAGTVIMDYTNNQTNWNETVYGGNASVKNLNFNCLGRSGFDIYISPVPSTQLDISNVTAATVGEIDTYIGINSSEMISSTSTFNETFTIDFGGIDYTGPGVRTKSTGSSENVFHQVALKDGNGVLFFGANATTGIPGFDGDIHNYQMMLPVPYNMSTITYYFFPDPITDILGTCRSWTYSYLSGYVNDNSTGLPLGGVGVQVRDSFVVTNASGYYSMFAPAGNHFMLSVRAGYNDYVDFVTIQEGQQNYHNFSMIPLSNASLFSYGYVSGLVLDTNGTPLGNATVMSGIFSNVTGADGNYTVISLVGNNTPIIATRTGYSPNVTYVDVTELNTTYQNITLSPIPEQFGPNGTVYGTVWDNSTNTTMANATVYIGSWSTTTDGAGNYSMRIPSYAFYYVIALKNLYEPFVGNLSGNNSVTRDAMINYDIYMEPLDLLTGILNETITETKTEYIEVPVVETVVNETVKELGNGTGIVIRDDAGKIAAYLSIRQIKTHIKQDSFLEYTIAFYNFQFKDIDIDLEIEGDLDDIFEVSTDHISVSPNDYGDVKISILGVRPPGLYEGKLRITGDVEATLPVEIRISKEGKIPIKTLMMNLDVLKKVVIQGSQVKYKLDLVNLLTDRKYRVDLKFYLANINGTKLSNVTEKTIMLETFTSLVGSMDIPEDFNPDDYVLRAQADYLGLTSTTDALFTVREPFYEYDLMGIIPVWLLATLIALLAMAVFMGQEIKRRQDAKKRFHAKVEYDLLPQTGDKGLFIGNIAETNKKAYLDMDKLTVHSIVAGSTGGGKSISAQDIIEEALLKGVAVAVFDPTAQWSGMLRKLEDEKFLGFYNKFGMDPNKDPRAFNGNIKAVKNGREIIDIFKYLKPGEIQVFTTSTLDPKDYDIFVASMIQQIFHSDLEEYRGLRYLLVFDEIHRILPKFGGSGAGFTQIERGCREFRKWGMGIVLISQVLSDFVGEIKANINTQIQMKTRDEGDLNRIKMQYGEEYIQSLVKSPVGSGMIQNSSWNRGRPYYVTFRPILHSVVRLSDEELDKYNHYNDIIDQVDYELDQLEELEQDVFDLRLELKLSKDKMKTGNFNMVQIYIDGLSPRVQKMWNKLGKKPEKLEIKLLSESDITAGVEKAKEETEVAEKTGETALPQRDHPALAPTVSVAAAEVSSEKPAAVSANDIDNIDKKQKAKGPDDALDQLFNEVNQSIAAGDKAAAVRCYAQIAQVYKGLPKEQKAGIYQRMIPINKKISIMK
ncbi:helicase HerA domain-containing protein [Nanoarchaeota archaeon]